MLSWAGPDDAGPRADRSQTRRSPRVPCSSELEAQTGSGGEGVLVEEATLRAVLRGAVHAAEIHVEALGEAVIRQHRAHLVLAAAGALRVVRARGFAVAVLVIAVVGSHQVERGYRGPLHAAPDHIQRLVVELVGVVDGDGDYVAADDGLAREILRVDRKSTRLNSSHLGISYAVFCLKKKNKNI